MASVDSNGNLVSTSLNFSKKDNSKFEHKVVFRSKVCQSHQSPGKKLELKTIKDAFIDIDS